MDFQKALMTSITAAFHNPKIYEQTLHFWLLSETQNIWQICSQICFAICIVGNSCNIVQCPLQTVFAYT